MNKFIGLVAVGITVFGTAAFAQDCSVLDGYARHMCQLSRNQKINQDHQQAQDELDRRVASDPRLSEQREDTRITKELMDCNHRHSAAGGYSPSGMFPDCEARYSEEQATLQREKHQTYIAEQQSQAQDSSVKFHYRGKYYIDPAVLQAYSMGVGNYGDIVGKDIVVTMVPITQVDRHGAKYWGYMGSTAVCISNSPIAISINVPVSVSGRVRGTTVSTIVSGREQAQMNTVVIDNCHIGPPEDEDQIWALAQRGQ